MPPFRRPRGQRSFRWLAAVLAVLVFATLAVITFRGPASPRLQPPVGLPTVASKHYPNYHSALTMLASESYVVEMITSTRHPAAERVDKVLQNTVSGSDGGSLILADVASRVQDMFATLPMSGHFIAFFSYDRSGSCFAATFQYLPSGNLRLLTNFYTRFGPDAPRGFQLTTTKFLSMPQHPTYVELAESLYPTGGILYGFTSEEWCPGP